MCPHADQRPHFVLPVRELAFFMGIQWATKLFCDALPQTYAGIKGKEPHSLILFHRKRCFCKEYYGPRVNPIPFPAST